MRRAANDDVAPDPGLLANAPRPLLGVLAAYLLILLGCAAVTRDARHLVQAAVVAVVAWRALQGSRPAALLLGVLFFFGAVTGVRDTVALASLDALEAAVSAVYTVVLAAGAVYVLFSAEVRLLDARSARDRGWWR